MICRNRAGWAGALFLMCTGASALQCAAAEARMLSVCPRGALIRDCEFDGIAWAADAARDGDTIVLRPGLYREAAVLRAARLTIRAEPGAHMTGVAAAGKAALVVMGDDNVIEGLECSEINVPDGNGACIRAEGTNLTLRQVHFHDSQQGILGGRGRVLIEDSRFERLGGDKNTRIGHSHGIYIGHDAEELILRRSHILASKEEGHEVKSRAKRTIIEDNVIGSLGAVDSRQIDIPNAGEIVIRRNVIQKGPNSTNPEFISIGLERGRQGGQDEGHDTGPALIEGNLFINDYRANARLLRVENAAPAQFVGNTVVGRAPIDLGETRRIWTRKAAGLPPFPLLPPAPPP